MWTRQEGVGGWCSQLEEVLLHLTEERRPGECQSENFTVQRVALGERKENLDWVGNAAEKGRERGKNTARREAMRKKERRGNQ